MHPMYEHGLLLVQRRLWVKPPSTSRKRPFHMAFRRRGPQEHISQCRSAAANARFGATGLGAAGNGPR